MKNWYTISVLTCAFMLGVVATALQSGCQKVPDQTVAAPEETSGEEVAETSGESSVTGAASEEAASEEAASEEAASREESSEEAGEEEAESSEQEAGQELATGATDTQADAPAAGSPAVTSVADKSANAVIPDVDWPQWGGTSYNNNTPPGQNIPITWEIGGFDRETQEWVSEGSKNVRWVARLGSQTYGNPVVADKRVYVGTNNKGGWLKRYPPAIDLGCLLAFSEEDGSFLWQDSSEKLPSGRVNDWPLQGICCAPLVEGDRLWFVTSRGEVKCLDTEGFHDGEDDGPAQNQWARLFDIRVGEDPDNDPVAPIVAALKEGNLSEALRSQFGSRGAELPEEVAVSTETADRKWTAQATVNGVPREFRIELDGRLLSAFKLITSDDKRESDVVWVFDMMSQMEGQQIFQHNMCSCSVTALGDLLFVSTSNGVDESHEVIPSPEAPSFMAMDKHTGEVYWTDKSPGVNILHGQWSSPTAAILGGVPQVIFAGGDGWVYSFQADKGTDGKPTLLWKFDANPKESEWILGGRGTRNNIIATPVVYDGLVYVAVGQDPEHGDGEGRLWCLDPTKRGDVSAELAIKIDGDQREEIPPRRLRAVNPDDGEVAEENPNSAVVWEFAKYDRNGDGSIDFEEEMHRSCGTVAIKDDLLFIADFSGLFHCLDAKTGVVHWSHDMLAAAWGSPLIVDGHVYIGDEDGDVAVFRLSADPSVAMKEIDGELFPINAREEEDDEYLVGDVTRMGNSVYSTPIVANNVLYIANRTHLFAIAADEE